MSRHYFKSRQAVQVRTHSDNLGLLYRDKLSNRRDLLTLDCIVYCLLKILLLTLQFVLESYMKPYIFMLPECMFSLIYLNIGELIGARNLFRLGDAGKLMVPLAACSRLSTSMLFGHLLLLSLRISDLLLAIKLRLRKAAHEWASAALLLIVTITNSSSSILAAPCVPRIDPASADRSSPPYRLRIHHGRRRFSAKRLPSVVSTVCSRYGAVQSCRVNSSFYKCFPAVCCCFHSSTCTYRSSRSLHFCSVWSAPFW